jgi:phosphoribosylanthranilate isomerase
MVPPFVDTVLVVPDRTLVNHIREFRNLSPDLIQIYGTSISPGTVRESLHARVIKPLLVGKNTRVGTEAVDGYDAVLSDTYKMGSGGGTGEVSNWEICRRIRRQLAPLPFILSGGLRPENIILAIKKVKPFAVDVSSGVEISPGIKDRKKMTEFVARAKMDGKAQEL